MGSSLIRRGEDWLHGTDTERLGKKAEVESGKRPGMPSDVAERLKALERENHELRQADEMLRKASAYFARAEIDRRFKP